MVLLVVVELLVLLAFALSISFYLLARKTDPEEKPDDLTQSLHILAVVTNILLLPHLLVLALHRDGWLNQILRLISLPLPSLRYPGRALDSCFLLGVWAGTSSRNMRKCQYGDGL